MPRMFIVAGSLLAGLGVILGAFGAHVLKNQLSTELLVIYHTAVNYHIYHALGLILIGILSSQPQTESLITWSGYCLLAGIVLFCGSLYLLSITGQRWLGAVTPFGGTAFILGWVLLALSVWRRG
jgi:uncharacterized membrane protein YgdD (TMEM256/DUF423 family)